MVMTYLHNRPVVYKSQYFISGIIIYGIFLTLLFVWADIETGGNWRGFV